MSRDPIDQEFMMTLALSRERDAGFDSWFYDQSIVYVYGRASENRLDVASNLLHEFGHAELANTPLGFLHQTLFEIVASLATRLYEVEIREVLRRHAPPPPRDQASDERKLLRAEPREKAKRDATAAAATETFIASQGDLTDALSTKEAAPLVTLFRKVQGRRKRLAAAAWLCQEAAATHTQLGPRPGLPAKYQEIAADGRNHPTIADIESFLVSKRGALEGGWRDAYRLAREIHDATGHPDAPMVAAKLAHHFAYPGVALLDMSDGDFERAVQTFLSADARFRRLALMRDALAGASKGRGAEATLLSESLAQDLRDLKTSDSRSFFRWIDECVLRSAACREAGWVPKNPSRPSPVDDDWTKAPIQPAVRRPPIVLSDGRVVAESPEEAALVRMDVVRGRHVRVVERILRRLTQ